MKGKQNSILDWMLLVVLAVMWGVSFILIKKSVTIYPPAQAVFVRMSIAGLVYLPVAIIYLKKVDWQQWPALVVVSLCGSGVPNFLYAVAQTQISSAVAGILNSLTPFFTLILGALLFKIKATENKWTGVLVGLAGAFVLIFWGSSHPSSSWLIGGKYPFLCVLATICYAVNANTVQKFLYRMHPIAIGSASFLLTAIPYFIGFFWSGAWETTCTHPNPQPALLSLGYLAVFGTAVASMLYFYLVQRSGAIFATSVAYLMPIVAIFFGISDGEIVTPLQLLGAALILLGLYLTRQS